MHCNKSNLWTQDEAYKSKVQKRRRRKAFIWLQQTRNVKCVNNLLVVVWRLCVLFLFCKLEFLFVSSFFLCKGCTRQVVPSWWQCVLNMVQFSIEFIFFNIILHMVSTSMKEKKSSSWWYFVCSTINLGWLLIPTECAEDIINPAKAPKHKQQ